MCIMQLTRNRTPNHKVLCFGGATSSMYGPVRLTMEASPAPMMTLRIRKLQYPLARPQPMEQRIQIRKPQPARFMHVSLDADVVSLLMTGCQAAAHRIMFYASMQAC